MKKIALMSVADINNYGDIMFPLVMRFEIQKRIPSVEFRFFTPTSRTFCGELFYEYTKQNMLEYAPDAIIAAGGEVIHKYASSSSSLSTPFFSKQNTNVTSNSSANALAVSPAMVSALVLSILPCPSCVNGAMTGTTP